MAMVSTAWIGPGRADESHALGFEDDRADALEIRLLRTAQVDADSLHQMSAAAVNASDQRRLCALSGRSGSAFLMETTGVGAGVALRTMRETWGRGCAQLGGIDALLIRDPVRLVRRCGGCLQVQLDRDGGEDAGEEYSSERHERPGPWECVRGADGHR
jgi:hypothetical protein